MLQNGSGLDQLGEGMWPEVYIAELKLLGGKAGSVSQHPRNPDRVERSAASPQPSPHGLLPAISVPKGGGAIRGIGEKFATHPATGTASLSIPIATSPGRAGFELGLALTYDSGAGNGPFGLGWQLSIPSITRKTDHGIPRYLDDTAPDVFVLSGAEDLVPARLDDGSLDVFDRGDHHVQRYRPRTEGLFARIERWTDRTTCDVHWRVTTRDDVLSIYGKNPDARIADPEHPERVFSWLLEDTRDDRGHIARYIYKPEDSSGIDPTTPSEGNRFETHDGKREFRATAQRYLKRILYGNRHPVLDRESPAPAADNEYLFEVVFDYGEHDRAAPSPRDDDDPRRPVWQLRADPFSSYRAAFEVRTYRVCQRVLMFHRFAELGPEPCLVRSTDFTYDGTAGEDSPWPVVTYLVAATQAAYRRGAGASYDRAALPPLVLGYVKPEHVFRDELVPLADHSLECLARGVDGSAGQWLDLDGEGLPGVLLASERAWYYKANLGDGKLAPPRLETTLPCPAGLSGGVQLADLGGDGNLDLVRYAPPLSGYFERNANRTWAAYVALQQVPHVDWQDPNLRFLDIDGDGLPDILISERDAFRWYRSRGKQGFEPALRAGKPVDERDGPAVSFHDGTETIQLADMTGDGLVDIVRVRNGEVCYWPNLGHGRFGRRVTFDHSPWFDAADQFDPRRIRFADIDGSGTSDIVYLGRDGARLYFNQSGNRLTGAKLVASIPLIDSASSASVVDLLGRGTACLVWSSSLAGGARSVLYVDLMGGKKPHLLESVVNNVGGETRITYASSTQFYLEDHSAGRPWLTRLSFPVHVVERVERIDHIARSKLVTRFAYHHGYFDGDEREFRGFARVEQWDAESFSGDGDLNLPPARTVTWFHTGAWLVRERLELALAREYYAEDPQAPVLPDTPPLTGLTIREQREAARALRGQILRQEIYAEDLTPEAAHPYSVSERSHAIRRVQASDGSSHAVFFVHPSQTVTIHYERRPGDPRVQHEIVLDVDDFGQITRSASIGYPRRRTERQREESDTHRDLAEQDHAWATLTEHGFANRPSETDWYRVSVPTWTRTLELTDLAMPPHGILDPEALQDAIARAHAASTIEDRTIDWEQRFYYGDHAGLAEYRADTQGLPPGEVGRRALLHHVERFAFTAGFVARIYGGAVNDALLAAARYRQHGAAWWAPSGRAVYDPARFFLTVEAVDPFDQWTAVEYDVHGLLPIAGKEPRVAGDALSGQVDTVDRRFGSVTRAEPDYRVLATSVITDSNRNSTRVVFNTLGLPEEIWRTAGPGKTGGDHSSASMVFRYGLDAWLTDRKPIWSHTARRAEHDQGGSPFSINNGREQLDQPTRTGWLHARLYTDGSGREVMTKVMAEPGPVPTFDGVVVDCWVGTGRTVFDNKGNVIKKYEPFFSDTLAHEDEPQLVERGVTDVLRYDPLGRLVRTDHPDHTFARVDFDAWSIRSWDENDTVMDSAWYAERGSSDPALPEPTTDPARRAAWLAARHAGTFSTAHLDALGRTFLRVADDRPAGYRATRLALDIAGNETQVIDARGVRALAQDFDALRRKLRVHSADAGDSRTLLDVADKVVRTWDPRGYVVEHHHDELQRPKQLVVTDPQGATRLAERIGYGELQAQAEANNLRGKPHQLHDGAGIVTNSRFDVKGNLLTTGRRLIGDYRAEPDWSALDGKTSLAAIPGRSAPLVDLESFQTDVVYDALDRVVSRTTPDGKLTTLTYNEANLVERVEVDGKPYITGVDYNARGQRVLVSCGNQTQTSYRYDATRFRLLQQRTTRLADNVAWQDLSYEYDPVGNITQITDRASLGRPAHAPVVPADGDLRLRLAACYGDRGFVYDALYQLVEARGRHHGGQQLDAGDAPCGTFLHPNDPQGLTPYAQSFDYDAVGNLVAMACQPLGGTGSGWTRRYEYATDGNRLTRTSAPGDPAGTLSASYDHDDAGNITRMPHLPAMQWDHANRLRHVARQALSKAANTNDVHLSYDSTGARVRKVYEHGDTIEERIYLGEYEIYRERTTRAARPAVERQTLHVMDGEHRVALLETKTIDAGAPVSKPAPRARYQLEDHLASAVVELDENGAAFSFEEHYAFGETSFRASSGMFADSAKRYRYSGKERDEETGLYYYGARYYAAWLGRWTSCDPSTGPSQTCLYKMTENNPLRYVDHMGLFEMDTESREQSDLGIAMVKVSEDRNADIKGKHGFNLTKYNQEYKWPLRKDFMGINVPDLDPFHQGAARDDLFKQTPSSDPHYGYTYCIAGVTTLLGLATQNINDQFYHGAAPTMGPLKTQKQFVRAYGKHGFANNPAEALIKSGLAYRVDEAKDLHIGAVVQLENHAAVVKENDPVEKRITLISHGYSTNPATDIIPYERMNHRIRTGANLYPLDYQASKGHRVSHVAQEKSWLRKKAEGVIADTSQFVQEKVRTGIEKASKAVDYVRLKLRRFAFWN